jgi:hypothetical protein
MKFSDNIIREPLDEVFVKRSEVQMDAREESNSNLVDVQEYDVEAGVNLYQVPVRDVKIGESIYDERGKFVAYRSN